MSWSDVLDEALEPAELPIKQEYRVTDLHAADWCARKIIRAERRIQERILAAAEAKAKIDGWLTCENKKDEDTITFLAGKLEPWAREYLIEMGMQDYPKRRGPHSVKLPSGVAGFRKSQDGVDIEDEAAALAWCRENLPGAVKTKEYLGKTEIKEAVKGGAPLPDGVAWRAGAEQFYVKEEEE